MARVRKPREMLGNGSGAKLDFEAKLLAVVDQLRNNVDPAEYKQVIGAIR